MIHYSLFLHPGDFQLLWLTHHYSNNGASVRKPLFSVSSLTVRWPSVWVVSAQKGFVVRNSSESRDHKSALKQKHQEKASSSPSAHTRPPSLCWLSLLSLSLFDSSFFPNQYLCSLPVHYCTCHCSTLSPCRFIFNAKIFPGGLLKLTTFQPPTYEEQINEIRFLKYKFHYNTLLAIGLYSLFHLDTTSPPFVLLTLCKSSFAAELATGGSRRGDAATVRDAE